jgi:hypothetical protein
MNFNPGSVHRPCTWNHGPAVVHPVAHQNFDVDRAQIPRGPRDFCAGRLAAKF